MTKVWTYTIINWDVLNDDNQDALGIPTRFAFKTMEAAKKAADDTYFEACTQTDPDDVAGVAPADYVPLVWEPDLNGDHGDLRADTPDNAETYLVYGMEVVDE